MGRQNGPGAGDAAVVNQKLIQRICLAIARFEGFYKDNSKAQRNNNPGNLRSWGKSKVVGGFAKFATTAEGWGALQTQVAKNVYERKLTCYEFFGGKKESSGKVVYPGYAPDSDGNHSRQYAEFVAGQCGIKPDKPICEQSLDGNG